MAMNSNIGQNVAGRYVCSGYVGTPHENGYHHVTIEKVRQKQQPSNNHETKFRWTNRAGITWSLTYHSSQQKISSKVVLQVGQDCPYYASGHTECLLELDNKSDVVSLKGPGNERYHKLPPEPKAPPPKIEIQMKRKFTEHKSGQKTSEQQQQKHVFLFVISSNDEDDNQDQSWLDLAFLAAISASTQINHGRPTVLWFDLTGNDDPHDDATLISDFLTRYQPTHITVFQQCKGKEKVPITLAYSKENGSQKNLRGNNSTTSDGPVIRRHVLQDLPMTTIAINKIMTESATNTTTTSTKFVIITPMEEYDSALLASSLAARIQAPLFFVNMNVQDCWNPKVLQQLPDATLLFVHNGIDTQQKLKKLRLFATEITSVAHAMNWLVAQAYPPIDYIAVVNPHDRNMWETTCPKISLTGPIYAARHLGLVVPIASTPVPTTDSTPIKQNYNRQALDDTLEMLRAILQEASTVPEHIALVGGLDIIPTWQTDSDCNNSKDFAVSDIPYGHLMSLDHNHNEEGSINHQHTCHRKRFREIAIGRIYAESLLGAALLAARTVNYELLVDPAWSHTILEAGTWGFPEISTLFRIAGIGSEESSSSACHRHVRLADMEAAQVMEAAAFLHKDHSGYQGLGNFVSRQTKCRYAPALVVTRGCHGASIDEGGHDGTVAGRMLARGCVCYLGSSRSPTTANTLTEVAFFHELLYSTNNDQEPISIGQAMREAFNKSLVNHLDGGVMDNYCLENEILLGDPALVPCFAKNGTVRQCSVGGVMPATASCNESGVVNVVGPSEWHLTPIHPDQLAEWKYQGHLFTYVAPCVEQETTWCGKGYDHQELFYTVSVPLPKGLHVTDVRALDAMEVVDGVARQIGQPAEWTKHWWQSGRHFVHSDRDGSTTVRWRIRLLDYNMETGLIRAELKSARFQLVFG